MKAAIFAFGTLAILHNVGVNVTGVLAGLGMTRAYRSFGWFKRHFTPITVVSGLLLAIFGALMVTGQLTQLSGWFQGWLPDFLWDV